MIEHLGYQVVEELPEWQRQEGALILRRSQRFLRKLKFSKVILVNFILLPLNKSLECLGLHEAIEDEYFLVFSNFLGATRLWQGEIIFFLLIVTFLTQHVQIHNLAKNVDIFNRIFGLVI